jgi:streptomycin 6-kinase
VDRIPDVVAAKARALGADAWLAGLPDLVAGIERDWDLRVGRAYDGATEAYVAAATLTAGTPAVLKLAVPRGPGDDALAREIAVLRLAGGHGCADLLRADPDRGALLLERLGPSLHDLGLPIGRRHTILCAAAQRLWRPVGAGAGGTDLPTGADHGRLLVAMITARWEALDRPCTERAVDHALACAAHRIAAHDDERAVLVHGDLHQWNTLRAGGPGGADGFKLIDPDGLRAEPEHDLGVVMREDPVELMAGDPHVRARWLAARTGLDATAIWEWGVVERVSTGLLGVQVGLEPVASQMLAAADRLAPGARAQPARPMPT